MHDNRARGGVMCEQNYYRAILNVAPFQGNSNVLDSFPCCIRTQLCTEREKELEGVNVVFQSKLALLLTLLDSSDDCCCRQKRRLCVIHTHIES